MVAKASIQQAEAALKMAETNLAYTEIRSPVEGVILDRRVNIGQTVVASLNAPSIFLIAKDLRRMEIWVSVSEADIGQISEGMPVRFSVDSCPGEKFTGAVSQIRLNAQMQQNVVTYTVVVTFDNSAGKLKPYLTASVDFVLEERADVLKVSNAALRWKPRAEQIAPDVREDAAVFLVKSSSGSGKSSGEGKSPGETAKPQREKKPERKALWVQDGDFVKPIEVKVGITDGKQTEVSAEGLTADTQVVIGEERKNASGDGELTNPFAPPRFGAKKK
jgi:HlyD family secretion protein